MPHSDFARTKDEVIERAKLAYAHDPFPEIRPALLSSADIERYARETAMLDPFYPEALKSASYEMRAGGRFIYWHRDGKETKKEDVIINRHTRSSITLPANSISYVQVEPDFRLPRYIAIRFNLRITHVHRGLLLGTGPLVDPGFAGQLLIPLHNLTSDSYEIPLHEALIWVEFTKTTYEENRDREIDFPESKKWKDPDYYFDRANHRAPILSSIHDSIEEAKSQAADAAANAVEAKNQSAIAAKNAEGSKSAADTAAAGAGKAEDTAKRLAFFGYVAIAAALIGVFSLIWNVHNVQVTMMRDQAAANVRITQLANDLSAAKEANTNLRNAVQQMRSQSAKAGPQTPAPNTSSHP